MESIRRAVRAVWREHELDRLPSDQQIALALHQFAEPYCEDKLAGVLALSELLLPELTIEAVPLLARPFSDDHMRCRGRR